MTGYVLPLDIREFLYKYIHSVSLLDTLFLFYKNPARRWTAERLNSELRTNIQSANNQIQHLIRSGLILQDEDESFYFYCEKAEMSKTLADLYHLYQERPVTIITFIYEKPSAVVKGFADAFKLTKNRDD